MLMIVPNSSSPHADNIKSDFVVLDEGPADDINGTIGEAKV